MSDLEYELNLDDNQQVQFDFKSLLFKIIGNWPVILIAVVIALSIAEFQNKRKQNIYRLESLISIENEQSPFFTGNTSISFNWGGVSEKVGKIITGINTRTHNDLVVDSLQFYVQYLQQGPYNLIDIYKSSPFELLLNKKNDQITNRLLEIKPLNENQFQLSVDFTKTPKVSFQNYDTKTKGQIEVVPNIFKATFNYGDNINLPFFSGVIKKNKGISFSEESNYFLKFTDYDATVNSYKNVVIPRAKSKNASSILILSMQGTNKARIVDYLNATVDILAKTELERKNIYATNTIKFIDSSLSKVNELLKSNTLEMSDFRNRNKVFDISEELTTLAESLKDYDKSEEIEQSKLSYLNSLEDYLLTQTDYTKIVAPSSVGVEIGSVNAIIGNIIQLAIERQNLEYTTQPGNVLFNDIDRRIESEKNVLLETIKSTKRVVNSQINTLRSKIVQLEIELADLPLEQQEYLQIQRRLDLSIEAYDIYQSKLSEAKIIKASNVSDINFIDMAKDIGGGKIGPDTTLNYVIAITLGIGIPILIIIILFLLDTKIRNVTDVEKLSQIPILGLIGKIAHPNNLIVHEQPQSSVSESFRSVRSSLQFILGKNKISDTLAQTILVTSSVSGEGKTFCSINVASVYASAGKKTLLMGLDLRKPKIFNDFDLDNTEGIVDYMIGERQLDEVLKKTHIKNLDLISSGPIPPNPSELLMSDKLTEAISILKHQYDYIILDSPPLGLVTDALDLSRFSDAILYLVRFDYTQKGMLQLINAKYKNREIQNVSYLLNFYQHKAQYGYTYGKGYGYGYGYGYGSYGSSYHKNNKRSIWSRAKKLISRNKK